jgi:uncharacterized protein YjiS (DUF1127 family)
MRWAVNSAQLFSFKETHMIAWIKKTYRYYNTIVELSRLSDKELYDLGLTRYEIGQVALKEYWRSNGLASQSFR